MTSPSFTILGTGNTAWHLTTFILDKGYVIDGIYGRDINKAEKIASLGKNINAISSLDNLNHKSSIYIICVSDDAIASLASEWPFRLHSDQIVVHTSGSKSIDLLRPIGKNIGVVWPIQSLVKGMTLDIIDVPLAITSDNDFCKEILHNTLQNIGFITTSLQDKEKVQLHLAAVFANNFTNHIFTLTEEFCKVNDLDFNLLHPLIEATAHRIRLSSPSYNQTGPAKRNDKSTIIDHTSRLQAFEDMKHIYEVLTESIRTKYNKE